MTMFAMVFGLVVGAALGCAVSTGVRIMQGATGTQIWIPGGVALRMFLPGIGLGMFAAMCLFPPAPPSIGSLSAEPDRCKAGDQITLTANKVRRSKDDLVWEGLEGNMHVMFFLDKNANGRPDDNEVLGDGDWTATKGSPARQFDTSGQEPGKYRCLARATVGGRRSNVASATIVIDE